MLDIYQIREIIEKAEWLHEHSDKLSDRVAIELPSTSESDFDDMGKMEWILLLLWDKDHYIQADCSFRHTLAQETISFTELNNRYDDAKDAFKAELISDKISAPTRKLSNATIKQLEMALRHQSEAQWNAEQQEAQAARARIRAEYALEHIIDEEVDHVVRGALYHAGKLAIGCEGRPRTLYGHVGADRELYGVPASTRDAQSDRAFGL